MPVYEFTCQRCQAPFEELVLGSEEVACPKCGATELEKRFSAFATSSAAASRPPLTGPGACGTCGDPRGPGACSFDGAS